MKKMEHVIIQQLFDILYNDLKLPKDISNLVLEYANPQAIIDLFTRIRYLKTTQISLQPTVKEWILESAIEKESPELRKYIIKEIYNNYYEQLDDCLKTPFTMNPWKQVYIKKKKNK